jgi:hypothetical protein
MKAGITIKRVWEDPDVVELRISVSDGVSEFTNQVYVAHSILAKTVEDLDAFKSHLHGGLLDIRFGEFGPEWANGAFHGRFKLLSPGRMYVTARQETDYTDFGNNKVASTATMHVASEPGLLDRFISELGKVASKDHDEAHLEGIDHP